MDCTCWTKLGLGFTKIPNWNIGTIEPEEEKKKRSLAVKPDLEPFEREMFRRVSNREEEPEASMASNFSTRSSASNGYGRRRNVLCKCGVVAPVITTWTNENGNIGRRFFGCGRFKEQNKRQCDFFQWYDEMEGNPRDKKLIAALLRRVEGMKKNEAMLIKWCVLGWSLVVFLLVVCVIQMMKLMKYK